MKFRLVLAIVTCLVVFGICVEVQAYQQSENDTWLMVTEANTTQLDGDIIGVDQGSSSITIQRNDGVFQYTVAKDAAIYRNGSMTILKAIAPVCGASHSARLSFNDSGEVVAVESFYRVVEVKLSSVSKATRTLVVSDNNDRSATLKFAPELSETPDLLGSEAWIIVQLNYRGEVTKIIA